MKTITKNSVIKRFDDVTAESKVKSQGWKYIPKSEWKKVWDGVTIQQEEAPEAETVVKKEPKTKKKKNK
jgi:hypothetical protein